MPRLDPEHIRLNLSAQRFGCQIESHEEIDSTNSEAIRHARTGAPEGTLIVADRQRGGRGRLGREWVSPPGCNLYCSLIVRPALPMAQVPLLTLMAGLATAETVAEWVKQGVGIKWPNDVLIHGRKAAGILTEMESDAERVTFVVVGIGVNLNAAETDFPPEIRSIATSVQLATGETVNRGEFCAHLLDRLEARYDLLLRDGFAALAPTWQRWDVLKGRRVQVRDRDVVIEGIARGLAADGRLALETNEGVRHIVAGDVSVVDGYANPGGV